MQNAKFNINIDSLASTYKSGAMYPNDCVAWESTLTVGRVGASFDFEMQIRTQRYEMSGELISDVTENKFLATVFLCLPRWKAYVFRLKEKQTFELVMLRHEEKIFSCLNQENLTADIEFYRQTFANESFDTTEIEIE